MYTVKTEFPDYDTATLPEIPADFVDGSWHNDACPSWINEDLSLHLYVDYADPSQRDAPTWPRFCLLWIDGNEEPHTIASGDDWQVILDAIDARRTA